MNEKTTLGQKIRKVIEDNNMTQKKFAESIGISPARLNHYVTGFRTPSFDVLQEITEKYHLRPSFFFGNVDRDEMNEVYKPSYARTINDLSIINASMMMEIERYKTVIPQKENNAIYGMLDRLEKDLLQQLEKINTQAEYDNSFVEIKYAPIVTKNNESVSALSNILCEQTYIKKSYFDEENIIFYQMDNEYILKSNELDYSPDFLKEKALRKGDLVCIIKYDTFKEFTLHEDYDKEDREVHEHLLLEIDGKLEFVYCETINFEKIVIINRDNQTIRTVNINDIKSIGYLSPYPFSLEDGTSFYYSLPFELASRYVLDIV